MLSDIDKIMEALRLFKGVKRVSLEENLNYPKLNNSIEELKAGKTVRTVWDDEREEWYFSVA